MKKVFICLWKKINISRTQLFANNNSSLKSRKLELFANIFGVAH